MNNLGTSLAFYLKHYSVISYLEEYDLENDSNISLPNDIQEILVQLDTVNSNAQNEYRQLKEQIKKIISDGLTSTFQLEEIKRRDPWYDLEIRLWPKKNKKPKNILITIGISLCDWNSKKGPSIKLWLWGRGGSQAEFIIDEVFNKKHVKAKDLKWSGQGTCIIKSIPLKISPDSLSVSLDDVYKELNNTLDFLPSKLQVVYGKIEDLSP